MPAEITTDPTIVSPYTIGTGTPCRVTFCMPEKLYDLRGSLFESSPEDIFGVGASNWDTPPIIKDTPIKPMALANPPPTRPRLPAAPAPAAPPKPAPMPRKPPTAGPIINAAAIRAIPIPILAAVPPAPEITGMIRTHYV